MIADNARDGFTYFAVVLPVFEVFFHLALCCGSVRVGSGCGDDAFCLVVRSMFGVVGEPKVSAQHIDAGLGLVWFVVGVPVVGEGCHCVDAGDPHCSGGVCEL